jgi:hypothetical protein
MPAATPPRPPEVSAASRGATAPEAKPMHLKKSWLWLLAASIGLSLAVPLALGGLGQFKLMDHISWWAALLFALM